ncbi:MAG TPA: sugar ABC transporter permease [Ilumatobacter sp.]
MGDFLTKLWDTAVVVVIAVAVSAAIWVGMNLIFNQVRDHWSRFTAAAYGACGFVVGALLSGNRITRGSVPGEGTWDTIGSWLWLPLLSGVVAGLVGWLLGRVDARPARLAIGVGGLGAVGLFSGAWVSDAWIPEFAAVPLIVWTAIGAAAGAAASLVRRRPAAGAAMIGAAAGWLVGAWAAPDLGVGGSRAWSAVTLAVPAVLVGLRMALRPLPTLTERSVFDQKTRAAVFIGPALIFIFATLIVPTVQTILLSFKDRASEEWVRLANYETIVNDRKSIDVDGWSNIFTSRLLWLGVALLVVFAVLGVLGARRTGHAVELGSASMGPLIAGGFFVSLAVFTSLRGTIVNNIWWVVVVTLFSTGLGLAIAVLADGAPFERVAKSFIFMPMAISLVGASVIWRFMYVARDASKEQTGVMNAIWIGLGRLSTGREVAGTLVFAVVALSGLGAAIGAAARRRWARSATLVVATALAVTVVSVLWAALSPGGVRVAVGLVLTASFAGLLTLVVKPLVRGDHTKAFAPGLIAVLLGWFLLRYWQIVGDGLGGQRPNSSGETISDPIFFIQDGPFNNMWLMVVLIWIQTGFAMVILSAAIKAVPEELLEAARVDGATASQIFWRVTLPQISTTIGVVVTTLIVLVMKVYDIVKVMTNGNFDTEVLANSMFREAFLNLDRGLGAALAVLIFVSVLPIMYLNIRRMQREA